MGIKVHVREGESIEQALKRFRTLVRRFGPPGAAKGPKWHKNQLRYHLKPSERRRRDRLRDEWQTYLGECRRHGVTAVKIRGKERRKHHFPG